MFNKLFVRCVVFNCFKLYTTDSKRKTWGLILITFVCTSLTLLLVFFSKYQVLVLRIVEVHASQFFATTAPITKQWSNKLKTLKPLLFRGFFHSISTISVLLIRFHSNQWIQVRLFVWWLSIWIFSVYQIWISINFLDLRLYIRPISFQMNLFLWIGFQFLNLVCTVKYKYYKYNVKP
jgi:hypothetical protein